MPSKSSVSDGTEQFTTVSRRSLILNPDDLELWEMFYYAGLTIDPKVFQAIIDLIRMDIHPKAVVDVLESVAPNSKYHVAGSKTGHKADTSQTSRKSRSSHSTTSALHTSAPSTSSRKSKSSSDVGKTDTSRLSKKTSRPTKVDTKQEPKAPSKTT